MAFARHTQAKRRALAAALAVGAVMLAPGLARASGDEEERKVVDARLEGLSSMDGTQVVDVTGPVKDGAALPVFAFLAAAGMAAGGLFKNARRSHLD